MDFGYHVDMQLIKIITFTIATIIGIGLWVLLKRYEEHIRIIILILLVVLGFISGCAFFIYAVFHIE